MNKQLKTKNGVVTVREALANDMADDDDPLLLYGECKCGKQHIVLELFRHSSSTEDIIVRRCACCGKEDHPLESHEMQVKPWGVSDA